MGERRKQPAKDNNKVNKKWNIQQRAHRDREAETETETERQRERGETERDRGKLARG